MSFRFSFFVAVVRSEAGFATVGLQTHVKFHHMPVSAYHVVCVKQMETRAEPAGRAATALSPTYDIINVR